MLQEILLSLSGVSSPILSRVHDAKPDVLSDIQQYASPPERAMLAELAQLSLLHYEIRKALDSVQNHHQSPICKAVSSAILSKHLAAFRHRILEVETSILRKDAAYVGGYDIIPLSTIVSDFAPWTRRLEWMRKTANLMSRDDSSKGHTRCSGAKLLDFLENESHTGYTDIGAISAELLQTAEISWTRTMSSWILYGSIPASGAEDFMIQQPGTPALSHEYVLDKQLMPHFVTDACAESILGIGNALNQLRRQRTSEGSGVSSDIAMTLLPDQIRLLNDMKLPLNASKLEAIMNSMNALVSENALSQLLTVQKILETCKMIQSYLLLGRGEFAIALINNVEERLYARQKAHDTTTPVRKVGRLEALVLKETELGAILTKTWSDLSALQSELETEDESFASARRLLKLTALKESEKPDESLLISTLAPNPTLVRIDIPIDSTLNIFISDADMAKYSHINSHLISIRRCQMKLANLWKLTSHRRCHPTPLGPPASGTEHGRRSMAHRRQRENSRSLSTRRYWSTMSKVLFVINELATYLQGEVIQNSWSHFHRWLVNGGKTRQTTTKPPPPPSSTATIATAMTTSSNISSRPNTNLEPRSAPHDPRTIAQAHHRYLQNLYSALFIDNAALNKSLSALLGMTDHFAALFDRLQQAWQGLDLQEDDGIVDAFVNYAQDESDVLAEMQRSNLALDQNLKDLVQMIKDVERERVEVDVVVGVASIGLSVDVDGNFVPWRARTLDRLIMKLDFLLRSEKEGAAVMMDEDDDDNDD